MSKLDPDCIKARNIIKQAGTRKGHLSVKPEDKKFLSGHIEGCSLCLQVLNTNPPFPIDQKIQAATTT